MIRGIPRVPNVEQELLSVRPVHLSSPSVLVLFVLLYLNISMSICLSFCPFSLCDLFLFDLRLLDYPFVIFFYCIVKSSLICGFLVTPLVSLGRYIVSPLLICTFLITSLVSFGHCIASSSLIYAFLITL